MPSAQPAPLSLTSRARKLIWTLIALLLVSRVVAMVLIPLTDSTEARYGEMARKMVMLNDWITPRFDNGEPFWAKPPMSTWLSAIGIKLFGINEFAVRLPALLLAAGMLWLVWQWVASRRSRDQALVTTAMLAGMALFYAAAGAVMTDSSLAICTTLTMVSFWNAMRGGGRHWGYLFFVGLGVGLLAKGPLVGVLTFLPIIPWLAIRGEWRRAWEQLPWYSGTLLMLVIGVPWYIAAEIKTPGFIKYFIGGEYIDRFLDSGWKGDKYGHAHVEPRGTIWLFWLYAAFPFSVIALGWLARNTKGLRSLFTATGDGVDEDGWNLYLLLWVVVMLVFFTFAGNIIWTYPFEGLPAFACLAVELFRRRRRRTGPWPAWGFIAAVSLCAIAGIAMSGMYMAGADAVMKASQKRLVDDWLRLRQSPASQLVYLHKDYQSAKFYTRGDVRVVQTSAGFEPLLHNHSQDFIVVFDDELHDVTADILSHFQPVAHYEGMTMYREIMPTPAATPDHTKIPDHAATPDKP